MLEDVLTAQDEERRRIARELHDEAGQSLTSVLVGLREIEDASTADDVRTKARALQRIVSATLEDLGRLARGLHPQVLDDLGFCAAVERHAAEVGEVHGLEVDVEFVGADSADLSMGTATALYRLVQEALTNAVRHGRARHVSLVVMRDDGGIHVTVEDDGCGFDVREGFEGSMARGLGLRSIRERVALLGGSVEIDSTPGSGTILIARVPLSEDAAHG